MTTMTQKQRWGALVLSTAAACTSSGTKSQTESELPPTPALKGTGKARFLLSLPADEDRDTACVLVIRAADKERVLASRTSKDQDGDLVASHGPCIEWVADLQKLSPSLPTDVSAANLAGAIHNLRGRDPSHESRVYADKLLFDFGTLLGPFDLSEHTVWKRSADHRGPDAAMLRPAAYNSDRSELSYDLMVRTQFDVTKHQLVVQAARVTVNLKAEGWPERSELLPEIDYHKPIIAEADRGFGGPVEGVAQIPMGKAQWYIAVQPGDGAMRHAWRDASRKLSAYKDQASLAKQHPEVATLEGRTSAAKVLASHFVEYGFAVIGDADAWKTAYRKEGKSTQYNPRYFEGTTYQDPVVYTVADFDSIASPTWRGDTLVIYLEGERNHQPYRVELDLNSLQMDSRLEPTFMATFTKHRDPMDPEAGPEEMPEPPSPRPR